MVIVSPLGRRVHRLEGVIPLENIDRLGERLVVHLLKRVKIVLNAQVLLRQVLVDHRAETRHLLVIHCRPRAFLRHVNPWRVSLLFLYDVHVQSCFCLLFQVLSVRKGFLDLLYSDNFHVVARNFVDGVDRLSAVKLAEDIGAERVVRDWVTCLVAHDHVVDVVVNLDFGFAKLRLELGRCNLSLSEFLNGVWNIILVVIDRLNLRFYQPCLSVPTSVVASPEIQCGYLCPIDLRPFFANVEALMNFSLQFNAYPLQPFVIDIERIFFQQVVAFRRYWQAHILKLSNSQSLTF